jgi:exodeoxyribonuclease-3
LKIATWNVNGIRARASEVLSFIEREHPDVFCLQEIKASADQVPEGLRGLPGYWSFWHGHKGYSGVALLLAKATFPGRPRFSHPEFDVETRVVQAELGELRVVSVYVPNGGKDFDAKLRFLEGFEKYAAAARAGGSQLLLCGDLNVAREERDVHEKLRKADQVGTTAVERGLLEKIIGHGLSDVLRKFAPDDDALFTWWAPWRNQRERNIGWRIDYVLASDALLPTSCVAFREFGTSDHGPVLAGFDLAPPRYESAPEGAAPPKPAGQIPLL